MDDEDCVRVPRTLAGHLLILAENYGSRYAEELEKIMYPKDREAGERMTDYRLPEGMTADRLRELAEDMAHRGGWSVDAGTVSAWADAIDPPEPESAVTNEMVEAYSVERHGRVLIALDYLRADLEAAVKCGWTPPHDVSLEAVAPPPVSDDLAERLEMVLAVNVRQGAIIGEQTQRLEMAEDLLRRAHHVGFHFGGGDADAIWCIGKSWGEVHVDVTAHEAKYLWSLFGEGDSDE